jgi:predicted DNA-binding transcriptional regulator AlpA
VKSENRLVPRIGLNRAELAIAIGVSPNTIDRMVEEGALPPPRKWHSRKIWIVTEVEAAMLEWPSDGRPVQDADMDEWKASA